MKNGFKPLLPLLLAVCLGASPVYGGSIFTTRHNLSTSGPGEIKASGEDRVCIFCHTPHRAVKRIPYLWNRSDSTARYTPYQSSTLFAAVGQPTGASKMCLSCHDGTIALGAVVSEPREIAFIGGIRFLPADRPSYLGTDLTNDHPVSFVYDTSLAQRRGELADPGQLPSQIKLDAGQQLQCTACHDPHDDTYGKFLVMSNKYSDLCTSCHERIGWAASSHATSSAGWNGQGPDPWPDTDYSTVAENGCQNCHRSHGGDSPQWLLKHRFEEDNCLVCHNGNVSSRNIEAELLKAYVHPVQESVGVHDPTEDYQLGSVPKHVECTDCHNAHRTRDDASLGAPAVSGANRGVSGIDIAGQQVAQSQDLYQICFKCHADNNVITSFDITRQIDQLNTRLEFDPGNPSFHPVAAPGVNPDVPSLISPLTTNSMIYCTDCHNSDDPAGPQGPHGSNFKPLLSDNYDTTDYASESAFNYALCYKCHSRDSILGDESFSEHRRHIVKERAPCSACHDAHGISQTQGNATNNSHLINFDLTIVSRGPMGRLEFVDTGRFSGQCFLSCHRKGHGGNSTYPRGGGGM